MIRIGVADKISIGILLTVVIGLWIPRLQGPIDLRYDAGVYYLTGTALASGKGYRIPSEPGEILSVQYPPLLAGIVASMNLTAGTRDPVILGQILRLCNFIFSLALVLATYAVGRCFLNSVWAAFGALVPALNVQIIFLSDLLFAELPYSLATMLFFILVLQSPVERSAAAGARLRLCAASILAAAGFLLRTSGLALLGAWIADLVLRRQWRQALVAFCLTVLCVGGWQAYVQQVQNDPSYRRPEYPYQRAAYQFYNVSYAENLKYVDPFQPELGLVGLHDLVARVQRNFSQLAIRIGETVTADRAWGATLAPETGRSGILIVALQSLWLSPVGIHFFAILPLAGLIVLLTRGQWLLPLYVGSSLALISLTPWPGQFPRYIAPLIPIFGIATAAALAVAASAIRNMLQHGGRGRSLAPIPALLIAGFILSVQLYTLSKMFRFDHNWVRWSDKSGQETSYKLFFYDSVWASLDEAIEWLSSNARQDAIVVTTTPHWLFIRTGLKAVMPPFESDPAAAQRLIDSVPATYLLVDKLTYIDVIRRYATPVLDRYPSHWNLVYATGDGNVQIYERSRSNLNIEGNTPGRSNDHPN